MVWVLVLLLILLGVLGYLLFAPFYLELNSGSGLCRVRFHRIASARLAIQENTLLLHLRIIGWRKRLDLLAQGQKREKPRPKKAPKKRPQVSLRKMWAVVRSFKVNRCRLAVDVGDVQTNGLLFPWLLLVGRLTGQPIGINFLHENEIILEIENSFFRMLWAYFKG